MLWLLAASYPRVTARCFRRWRITVLALAIANAVTIGVTGGFNSPILAACMYLGWIASVVVNGRTAIMMSLAVTCSVIAGYLLGGDEITEILAPEYRYGAVSSARRFRSSQGSPASSWQV